MLIHDPKTGQKLISIISACTYAVSNAIWSCTEKKTQFQNKIAKVNGMNISNHKLLINEFFQDLHYKQKTSATTFLQGNSEKVFISFLILSCPVFIYLC